MTVVEDELRGAFKAALRMAARFAVLMEFDDNEFVALAGAYVREARAEIDDEYQRRLREGNR